MRPQKPLSARNKMMDFLARRDHSEKELITKLKKYEFPIEEIQKAIQFAKDKNWLPDNEDNALGLSEKMASGLHKKKKGIRYINQYLAQKGLPPIKAIEELEVEKARACIQNKKSENKDKIVRFLMSRGFQPEVIRKVLK